jgi:hypothetical protein
MGVSGSVFFADWDELQRWWRDDPAALRSRAFSEEGWRDRFQVEDWWPEDWIHSWNVATEAGQVYDRLRGDLDARTRDALDRLLGTLFWEGRPVPPDLPGFEPGEGLGVVLGPQAVGEMAELAGSLDLESLRGPFAERCRKGLGRRVRRFEDFRDYVAQWLTMFQGARDSGKALVLWIA